MSGEPAPVSLHQPNGQSQRAEETPSMLPPPPSPPHSAGSLASRVPLPEQTPGTVKFPEAKWEETVTPRIFYYPSDRRPPSPLKPGATGAKNVERFVNRNRTKTGCLTCRKRRIKCGEEQPVCGICEKSGRVCEGYNQRAVWKPPIADWPGLSEDAESLQYHSTTVSQYSQFPPPPDPVLKTSSASRSQPMANSAGSRENNTQTVRPESAVFTGLRNPDSQLDTITGTRHVVTEPVDGVLDLIATETAAKIHAKQASLESIISGHAPVTRNRSGSSSSEESYFGQSDPRISSNKKKTVSFNEEAALHIWEQDVSDGGDITDDHSSDGSDIADNHFSADGIKKMEIVQCPICEKGLTNKDELRRHIKTHDTDPESHWQEVCKKCSSRFKTPKDLEKHLLKHTGERPFECGFPGCGYLFKRRDHCGRHVQNIHGILKPDTANFITVIRRDKDGPGIRHIPSPAKQVLDPSVYTQNWSTSQEEVDRTQGPLRNHVFRWEHPGAKEVFVTGTFDDWAKIQKLDRHGDGVDAVFSKMVSVPAYEDVQYKFVVDAHWQPNVDFPTITDLFGNLNNILVSLIQVQGETLSIGSLGIGGGLGMIEATESGTTYTPLIAPSFSHTGVGDIEQAVISSNLGNETDSESPRIFPLYGNETDSEYSYSVRSVESTPYTESSMTSYGAPNLSATFIHEFCRTLAQDRLLQDLCLTALKKDVVPREKLQRNFRRCLKAFARNLREESSDQQQYTVAGFVLRNTTRISSEFLSMLRPLDPNRKFQLPELPEDKRKTMEDFLKQLPGVSVPGLERLESLEKGEESDSDDQSLSDGAPEDDLPHLAKAKEFMTQSSSYKQLQVDVRDFLYPTFESKLRSLVRNSSAEEPQLAFSYDLAHLTAELSEVDPRDIQILEPKDVDNGVEWLQLAQGQVENLSGIAWDWWPLAPYQQIPKEDERSLHWICACGDVRQFTVPVKFAKKLQHIISDTTGIRERAAGTSNQKPSSTHPNSKNAAGSSTLAPGQGQYGFSTNTGGPSSNVPSATPTTSATQNHQPPQSKSLHILLVVASGNEFELSQIDVNGRKCNDFFRRLRKEYEQLRGFWRNWFSIWRYSHCDFYRCDKFDNEEFAPTKSNDYPTLGDRNYDYKPRPINAMPPVSRHEFFRRFYTCLDAASLRHRLMHKLTGKCKRLGLHNHDRLQLFPKRLSRFEEKGDEPSMFWGIYARERPALRYIVLYNVLCLLSPLLYFFLRMTVLGKTHDLQDAGVPFAMVAGALSVFWSVFSGSLQDNRIMKLD